MNQIKEPSRTIPFMAETDLLVIGGGPASIENLLLNRNQITEIKGLEKLTNLVFLSLENNQITEIKGLERLTNLIWLILQNNQIPKNILEECGGLRENGCAFDAQKFVKYCQDQKRKEKNLKQI